MPHKLLRLVSTHFLLLTQNIKKKICIVDIHNLCYTELHGHLLTRVVVVTTILVLIVTNNY